ncbi:MAG: hypothetical protein LBD99_05490 [Candidatus Margulisbacteria bacterium]|jgi:non-lysosomal glucosylceramidase|nr:hypothetical protein [Candidatus Margulisiibacteriota bacterium]
MSGQSSIPASAYTITLDKLKRLKPLKPGAAFPMINTFPHGSPLGGFGAGTFSRSPYGDFNIWHLFPGVHIEKNLEHCALVIRRQSRKKIRVQPLSLKDTIWGGQQLNPKKCVYSALYPRSWYVYRELDVTVEQHSPVLPHNYKETSYPVACFNVLINNRHSTPEEVSVLFSWQNILGFAYEGGDNAAKYKFRPLKTRRYNERCSDYEYQGILFKADSAGGDALDGEMCLATRAPAGARVSFCTQYDAEQPPDVVREPFATRGVLHERASVECAYPAGAIAVKALVNPGETVTVPFALVWDIPRCLRGQVVRYYTRYWGAGGGSAFALAKDALQNPRGPEIAKWQNALARKMPARLAGALFNELYYLADGGSLWDAESGMFSLLECFDYPFYETLDVRFYGSFPLAKLWPEIEKRIMREFGRTIFQEDAVRVTYHAQASVLKDVAVSGEHNKNFIQKDLRKRQYALPHDLGAPDEKPWVKLNAYTWQNANRWKDLNSKYVLLVYRAYYYSGKKDRDFLAAQWPGLIKAVEYLNTLDTDGDGLPENEHFPDQTFDNWLMRGTSAYCGILRLAALQAGVQIAELLAEKAQAKEWRLLLKRAKDSLNQKLWNGRYFRFDENSDIVMAAQLTGQWYLEQLHLPSVLEDWQIDATLKNVYRQNFRGVAGGRSGLINGRTKDGRPVDTRQGNDAWVGINYAFACHLLLRGQKTRAKKILNRALNALQSGGMLFRTPEAWNAGNHTYIASMYMRPGVIWALADWC